MYDVVDDWLERDLAATLTGAGVERERMESPGFLTTRDELAQDFRRRRQPRMHHFYERQRRRLDMLVDGDQPVGGRWSFDTENRKKLPEGRRGPRPAAARTRPTTTRRDRLGRREFPDNPGDRRRSAGPPRTGRPSAG